MIERDSLIQHCNQLLNIKQFHDYCPNGLQVEGTPEIRRLVTGVTASQALVDAAIACQADALLVHHGYFWKGENPVIQGIKKRRLSALLAADINLIAYHLPLDAHPEYGNNVQLAQRLGIQVAGCLDSEPLIWTGTIEQQTAADFHAHINTVLHREAVHINSTRPIKRLAWCTGGAQGYIQHAIDAGVDAYISGEISEQTTHIARESDIHYFAAGHHATERYGAQALGQHLAEKFDLEHEFIDIDNPA
jgi:dinuclear metal center YbgI/SA1388 family protein